jgi:plasmid stability protein
MNLSVELPDEQQAALNAKALEQGVSAEEYARRVLAHDLDTTEQRAIWEIIAENMKRVSSEDLAALPKDGLNQMDHYVYGVPKIEP